MVRPLLLCALLLTVTYQLTPVATTGNTSSNFTGKFIKSWTLKEPYNVNVIQEASAGITNPRVKRYITNIRNKLMKLKEKSPKNTAEDESVYRTTASVLTTVTPAWEAHILRAMLHNAAFYLQDHKFKDIDERIYEQGDDKPRPEPSFMKHFPLPVLRSLDSRLKKNCEKGFYWCLTEIDRVYRLTEDYTNRNQKGHKKVFNKIKNFFTGGPKNPYKPFHSARQRFKFRTTASYYMCLYTMERTQELQHFGQTCQGAGLQDYRARDHLPYGCALLSFCPDPCCGKINKGLIQNENDCKRSVLNPCHHVDDGTCTVQLDKNTNFDRLIRNFINITCNCEKDRPGFVWNQRYKICVDEDECGDGKYTCAENQVCFNTPGSYYCSCRHGYKMDKETRKCVLDFQVDFEMEEKQESPKEEKKIDRMIKQLDKTFIAKLQRFLGTSGASSISLKFPVYLIILQQLLGLQLGLIGEI